MNIIRRCFDSTLMASIAVGLFAFVLISICWAPVFAEWEQIMYSEFIFVGRAVPLILGRPGYVFPFHWLWLLTAPLFHNSFMSFLELVRATSMFFGGVAIASIYAITRMISTNRVVPLATAAFTLTGPRFIQTALMISPDMMMFGLAAAATALLVADCKKSFSSPLLLICSAVLLGFACNVHERALFFVPSLMAVPFAISSEKKGVIRRSIVFCILTLLVSSIGPLILAYADYETFMRNFLFSNKMSNFVGQDGFWSQLSLAIKTHSRYTTVMTTLALLGILTTIYKKSNVERRKLLLFISVWSLPSLLLTCYFVNPQAVKEYRFFLPAFFAFSLCAALGIQEIETRLRFTKDLPIVVLFAIYVNGALGLQLIKIDRKFYLAETQRLQNVYKKWSPFLAPDRVVTTITGNDTMYIHFRSVLDGYTVNPVWPGWVWPANGLEDKIENALELDNWVIYDPAIVSLYPKDADPKILSKDFKLIDLGNGLVRLVNK